MHPDCFAMSAQQVARAASEDTWACPLCCGDIEHVEEARHEARLRSEKAAAAFVNSIPDSGATAARHPDQRGRGATLSEDDNDADSFDESDDDGEYMSDAATKKKRAVVKLPRPRGRPRKVSKKATPASAPRQPHVSSDKVV